MTQDTYTEIQLGKGVQKNSKAISFLMKQVEALRNSIQEINDRLEALEEGQ